MSDPNRGSIVIDPQPEGGAPAPVEKPAEAGPTDPLATALPADLEGIDPTYRGKTVAEIIEMHKNASSKIGEQANEIGIWRNLVSEYAEGRAPADQQAAQGARPTEEPLEITSDQLLDNPVESIQSVVERSVQAALAPITSRLDQQTALTEADQLRRDYPEVADIAANEEFKEWAYASPERARLADATTKGDVGSARYLLDSWRDRQSVLEAVEKQNQERSQEQTTTQVLTGTEGARQATTESGGSGAPTAPRLNAREIIHMINTNPDKYHSAEFQAELQQAAKEGRLSL
jgi:hypothetical protein